MILKLSELRVVALTKFTKECEKTVVTLRYLVPKTYCSQRSQVAITLCSFAKDASNIPRFTFILHVHPQANCCSETFIGNSKSGV